MIDLNDVRAAAKRIEGYVRRTPLVPATQFRDPVCKGMLHLKLECLQPSGSFKARGAASKLFASDPNAVARGLVAASGGNHGLAVARSANLKNVPAHIFLPENVQPEKVEKMRRWGAETVIAGADYDEANAGALAHAKKSGALYFHSFADPLIVAGQGTVGLEIFEDLPNVDTVVIAVGGGGFITGAAVALKALKPSIRIVGVEPTGSPTLHNSLRSGDVVTLDEVTTRVPTMACRRTDDALFALTRQVVDEVVLVEDQAMADAASQLWFEFGIAADLSGAATIAALATGAIQTKDNEVICAPVCGAGLPL
ncbi:threonine/serine dehydratase [Chelativorans sp. AA-79]|uniref:threonine ammonia-lyase n=1 Tax=Chelativorans sp. AA-79 TaxID=3028735 RepID=UPI0023F7D180|nr:threonine/serine dehydratase [Chelativorans sp. AA-79]WEX10889.1 threonine/serine dehydratase [Chelativorans sp. AA-79]